MTDANRTVDEAVLLAHDLGGCEAANAAAGYKAPLREEWLWDTGEGPMPWRCVLEKSCPHDLRALQWRMNEAFHGFKGLPLSTDDSSGRRRGGKARGRANGRSRGR